MAKDSFLPTGYEVPASIGNYYKFQDGQNKFRILSSPIIGWEYWNEDELGKRTPIRKRMDEALVMSEIQEPDKVKHFWAMVVWNYKDERVQILEITQKGIQKSLSQLAADEDWGSPQEYDIVVTKTGKDLLTKYTVMPAPKKALAAEVKKAIQGKTINLEALYDGKDPFAVTQ